MLDEKRILARLEIGTIGDFSSPVDIPTTITRNQLQSLCNSAFPKADDDFDSVPYRFFVNNVEIVSTLLECLSELKMSEEKIVPIMCQPQAVFRVRPVTRCTSAMAGHGDSVLHARFSPNGRALASGSGDRTVRFWDLDTELPLHTCTGHLDWVMAVTWSGNGKVLASGCRRGQIFIWDAQTGQKRGTTMSGHTAFINSLVFKPVCLDGSCRFLASASKDGTVRIWDTITGHSILTLSSHTSSVTSVKWGTSNLIYSGSHDRTIKIWNADNGNLVHTLSGHAHWVNQITLTTDYVIKTGPFDPAKATVACANLTNEEAQEMAFLRVKKFLEKFPEVLASASDDFTAIIWKDNKPAHRLTGHQDLINDMAFSQNGQILVTASFDKSIKVWRSSDGTYLNTLRGHVSRVYQISWSPDSRLLCSGSFDSTVKVWDMEKMKLLKDLPGHSKEVFTVDWSPDGQRVVSGSFDKLLKIWRY